VHALGGWRVELELLQPLAAHGATPLPQALAVDTLWPDVDGDVARSDPEMRELAPRVVSRCPHRSPPDG
jgi:hypothetical protein